MSTSDSEANIPEWPHKPAPPEPKRLLPPREMLVRGIGLAGVSAGIIGATVVTGRKSALLALALAPAVAVVSGLFAWAAAIHLTGGEKFDDHKWV
jgi:hypothetical protein